jgi:spore germination protein GerM
MTPASPPRLLLPPGAARRRLWIVAGGGAVALALGLWLVLARLPHWLVTPDTDSAGSAASVPTGDTRKIHATLFYVSDDGSELVPVSQEVPYGETPSEQARRIAEAQLQAPPAGLTSAIPAGTKIRALFLTPRGDAYLDVSHDIITDHTGGSLDEALTVFAIVNALTVNLPDVSAVQILVDGKEVDTLVGHVDLRHPLGRSLKWVRKGQ